MAEYIDRQEAIDAVQRHREGVLGGYEYDEGIAFGYAAAHRHIAEVLEKIPSADVQPVRHGVWMEENRRPRSAMFYCSECHRTAYDIQPTRDKTWEKRCRYAYCPNCGARMLKYTGMDGEQND